MSAIPQAFWNWADSYYKENIDLIDVEALYDSAITVGENITLFKQNCPVTTIIPKESPKKTATETATINIHHKKNLDLDTVRVVAILGDRHTGKSNLMFKYMREYAGERQLYTYGYPKPVPGVINITNKSDLFSIRDGIIFFDEFQQHFKAYDGRSNEQVVEYCGTLEHSNNTLVLTTPQSHFLTKQVADAVDVWNLTRIKDLGGLKNGSKVKRIIQQTSHPSCTRWSMNLQNGEYLQYGEFLGVELNGVKTFTNQGVGKEWSGERQIVRVLEEVQ